MSVPTRIFRVNDKIIKEYQVTVRNRKRLVYRDEKGRFTKKPISEVSSYGGRPQQRMFRSVITINYAWHFNYYAYKGSKWYSTYGEAYRDQENILRETIRKFEQYRGYSFQELQEQLGYLVLGKSIMGEPYSNMLIGQKSFRDEFVRRGKRRHYK